MGSRCRLQPSRIEASSSVGNRLFHYHLSPSLLVFIRMVCEDYLEMNMFFQQKVSFSFLIFWIAVSILA